MGKTVECGKGIVVFLSRVDYRLYYATKQELKELLDGFKIAGYDNGTIISSGK
jgi:hypothetical protein